MNNLSPTDFYDMVLLGWDNWDDDDWDEGNIE